MGHSQDEQWAEVTIEATLAGREAGTGASEKARELRQAVPVRSVLARALRIHNDEQAWSKGALGERLVAKSLRKLSGDWYVFHDVEVGERGANIDHIVIGPGGVFTLNAKYLSGKVVVNARSVHVNGRLTDYLPIAAHEARRASKLLTGAAGRPVAVFPVLVFGVDELVVKEEPADVGISKIRPLPRWLEGRPVTLSRSNVIEIAGAAHKPTTWKPTAQAPFAGEKCSCGSQMVERTRRSDGARFLGCSRFPACRRTAGIDVPRGSGGV